jgi:hypothetical protein
MLFMGYSGEGGMVGGGAGLEPGPKAGGTTSPIVIIKYMIIIRIHNETHDAPRCTTTCLDSDSDSDSDSELELDKRLAGCGRVAGGLGGRGGMAGA